MDNSKIKEAADAFFATEQGKKLSSRRGELEKLADSQDGEKVKQMLSGEELKKAAESGDMTRLSAVVKSVLATEEGKRIAQRISEIIK